MRPVASVLQKRIRDAQRDAAEIQVQAIDLILERLSGERLPLGSHAEAAEVTPTPTP